MNDRTAGSGPRVSLVRVRRVSEQEAAEVARIETAAESTDAINPLDDQVRSELRYGAAADSHHVLGRLAGQPEVVAYAHAVRDEAGVSGHVVVHPDHRGHGIGREIVDHLLSLIQRERPLEGLPLQSPARHPTLRLWAHGNTEGAQALAAARGLASVRELMQMRRDLGEPLPVATYPDDVTVRSFQPDSDEEAWVALNALAFAAHPEQGRLTVEDLQHRMAESWFDPAGFFLAERGGELLGSHWTKVHPAGEAGAAPVGEVYAVGVHPDAQGLGLGKALTLSGLEHLRSRGLREVMLYVDGDNPAAVNLYRRLGFETSRVDVMYATR